MLFYQSKLPKNIKLALQHRLVALAPWLNGQRELPPPPISSHRRKDLILGASKPRSTHEWGTRHPATRFLPRWMEARPGATTQALLFHPEARSRAALFGIRFTHRCTCRGAPAPEPASCARCNSAVWLGRQPVTCPSLDVAITSAQGQEMTQLSARPAKFALARLDSKGSSAGSPAFHTCIRWAAQM